MDETSSFEARVFKYETFLGHELDALKKTLQNEL